MNEDGARELRNNRGVWSGWRGTKSDVAWTDVDRAEGFERLVEELREKSDNGGSTVAIKNRISSLEYFCAWMEESTLKWLPSEENEDRRC